MQPRCAKKNYRRGHSLLVTTLKNILDSHPVPCHRRRYRLSLYDFRPTLHTCCRRPRPPFPIGHKLRNPCPPHTNTKCRTSHIRIVSPTVFYVSARGQYLTVARTQLSSRHCGLPQPRFRAPQHRWNNAKAVLQVFSPPYAEKLRHISLLSSGFV